MRRRVTIVAAGALALALVLPGPVAAAAPQQPVTFSSVWVWGPTEGTFSASPPLCPSGITHDLNIAPVINAIVAGSWRGVRNPGLWRKEFDCGNGTTFTVQLQGTIWWGPPEYHAFTWVILDASGDLAGLSGHGTGYSDDATSQGGTDHFEGTVVLH